MNTTYSAKPEAVKRSWYLVDAKGQTLGRIIVIPNTQAVLRK